MKLSPHFTLAEFTKSQVAARHGIDNRAPPEAIGRMKLVAELVLEPVREAFARPFSPSSGYRCLELNRLLGSADNSQHLLGEAVDFEVPGIDNLQVARWIRSSINFDQLILECYEPGKPDSGWVHVSYRPGRLRGEVLTIGRAGVQRGLPA